VLEVFTYFIQKGDIDLISSFIAETIVAEASYPLKAILGPELFRQNGFPIRLVVGAPFHDFCGLPMS
jgi:hypothetical protein